MMKSVGGGVDVHGHVTAEPAGPLPRPRTRADRFATLLRDPEPTILMEAHNGLSARIAERNGFSALWASGLTIATTMGLRDVNEATWSEVLTVLDWMLAASTLPILIDGDSGFGNFNNFRRMVRTLSEKGGAGVVIEDKLFPKKNSFVGNSHPLADIDEVCGKIMAGKDAQITETFTVVARLEGFIAGADLKDVMKRAERYHQAGADAIFVHSRRNDTSQIQPFLSEWSGRTPCIVAPTKFNAVPFDALGKIGVNAIICANQSLRAAMRAMDQVTRHILEERGLASVEKHIMPLDKLFDLLDYAELEEAERRYLPGQPEDKP